MGAKSPRMRRERLNSGAVGVRSISADSGQSESTGLAAPPGRRIRGLDADQRRERRGEQLLSAAFELFARDGYACTTIEQICQTAYVGTKAFYELFDSKEDCYLALLQQTADEVQKQVTRALAETPADEPEQQTVRRVIAAFAHALVDDPRVALLGFRVGSGILPRVEADRQENRRWAAAFIEAYWRRNEDAEGCVDYRALAVATVGGLFESVADFVNRPEPSRSVEDLISTMTTFVLAVEAEIGRLR